MKNRTASSASPSVTAAATTVPARPSTFMATARPMKKIAIAAEMTRKMPPCVPFGGAPAILNPTHASPATAAASAANHRR